MSHTYAKVFPSMYSGSMYGAGMNVFAVWGWILAHKDENDELEINTQKVAHTLGGTIEGVESALAYLMKPDPQSRNKECEGRRLLKISEFGYRVVNGDYYRRLGGRRAEYWQIWREKQRLKSATRATVAQQAAQHCATKPVTQTETETEIEIEKKKKERGLIAPRRRFAAPSPTQVEDYAKSINYQLDGQLFVNHYAATGWTRGKGATPIKDWKACVRTWRDREHKEQVVAAKQETNEETVARMRAEGLLHD